jgi:SAM-dependent methyltransferase
VAAAALNPEAEYLGVDLCRASLEDARAGLAARGLTNASLQEVDLMTLEGLRVPEGGFDVIHSSGVVHHLADPEQGLRRLGEVLAPHGVLQLMVYGTIGRRHIRRVRTALAHLLAGEPALDRRLAAARALVEALADAGDPGCPFRDAAAQADAEFVDRYLHPNERDYDVPGLFDLVEGAGLRFLAWVGKEQYSLEGRLEPGPVRDAIEALPQRERFAVVEQIVRPRSHELLLCKPGNGPRELPPLEAWGPLWFAANPECTFQVTQRNLPGRSRTEAVHYGLYDAEPVHVQDPALQRAALLVASQNEPFQGGALVQALVEQGLDAGLAARTLQQLVDLELIHAPHAVDLERP